MNNTVKSAISLALLSTTVIGDSITHNGTSINMDFVNIGHQGNTEDSSGFGSVEYNYRIGKFEVTLGQFQQASSADNRLGSASGTGVNGAVTGIWWRQATMFANWLTSGDAYTGAYQFNQSGSVIGVDRAAALLSYETVYVLPTEDEWYKAAYFKADGSGYSLYAHGNSTPTQNSDANYGNGSSGNPWNVGSGTVENNGTFDMDGNVWEFCEDKQLGGFDVIRGGSYFYYDETMKSSYRYNPRVQLNDNAKGFRVAAIPEPSTFSLIGLGAIGTLFTRRQRRKKFRTSSISKLEATTRRLDDRWLDFK